LVYHLETLRKHIFFLFGTNGYKNTGHQMVFALFVIRV